MDSSGRIYDPEEVEQMDEQRRRLMAMIPAEDVSDVKSLSRRMRKALYRGLRQQQRETMRGHSQKPRGLR